MLLRPQYRTIAPAALYGGGVLQEDYTTADTMTWVTHARTGHATMFDSTGKLTWAPNNLLTYSNDFSNAAWTKTGATVDTTPALDPDGTSLAQKLVEAAGTSEHRIDSVTATITAGDSCIYSVYAKAAERDVVVLRGSAAYAADPRARFTLSGAGSFTVDNGSPTCGITSVGNGWYLCWMKVSITSTTGAGCWIQLYNGAYSYAGSAGSGVYIYKSSFARVTYETSPRSGDVVPTLASVYYGPRFDYNPNTLAKRGLLREMARTNLALQSNTMASAWSTWQASITTDGTKDPDGTTDFRRFLSNSSTGSHSVYPDVGFAISSGSTYAYSIYCKYSNIAHVFINLSGTANNFATAIFDISGTSDGTATQTGVGSSSGTVVSTRSTYLGSGVWRLTLVAFVTSSSVGLVAGTAPGGTGNVFSSFGSVNWGSNPLGTEVVYWGKPQLELGSFATSYIPTTTTSVLRNADTLTAALHTSDSVTEYYRLVSDLSQTSRTVNPFSGVSSATDSIWVEKFTKP